MEKRHNIRKFKDELLELDKCSYYLPLCILGLHTEGTWMEPEVVYRKKGAGPKKKLDLLVIAHSAFLQRKKFKTRHFHCLRQMPPGS